MVLLVLVSVEDREQNLGDDGESRDRYRIADLYRAEEAREILGVRELHAMGLRKFRDARRDGAAAGIRICHRGRQGQDG